MRFSVENEKKQEINILEIGFCNSKVIIKWRLKQPEQENPYIQLR